MINVHVIYAHPGGHGFTGEVLDAFREGLAEAGHAYTVSDLYRMGFRPDLSRAELERRDGDPVPEDVAAEQARLDAADVWVFVYPVWWADCPALLKGWFDRVWSVGWAYKPMRLRPARTALVLCTAGYDVAELEASGVHQAMRTAMITDRIGGRAERSEFVVLGGSTLRGDDPRRWAEVRAEHLRRVRELGRAL
ncbi:NAD(P)H-dependent oxidoreductase [Actinoplanes aureus]|uniref:NAD(P)H-dependent oxidoreductase n=1 Tax=Actinoplanes aureus TaxID=2792083 RepID=A0A931CA82_9ACTN|nr:NAD(P)H-dependent oxidoreductase [Actinoplanes aureus]MBG0564242.1 NAD(P)H-dependent oxidoreductase [Actinoplanes aureus]